MQGTELDYKFKSVAANLVYPLIDIDYHGSEIYISVDGYLYYLKISGGLGRRVK